jgi:hypothetical protein
MPTISSFHGVVIRMYWRDHEPPHFHAVYVEFEALIDIRTGGVIRGALPSHQLSLTLRWTALHREALLTNWDLCATNQTPRKIPPLD